METNIDILTELTLLSPLISGMDKVNVFTVPQGYFDSISTTVVACLQEEDQIFNLPEKKILGIPEGYFDQLAESILDRIKGGETALDEISSLSPLLHAVQNKNVYEVPDGYFETLNSTLLKNIIIPGAKEELKEISPLLYSIQGKEIFEIPGEYFSNLPGIILKKVQPQHAKVVSMSRRSILIRYAVAAMMTGVVALGLYKYIDKPLAGVHTVATLDAAIEKGKSMNDKQFNEALGNLTDGDIAKYLENNGDIADVTVLKNNLEDATLPSQEDYLLDETTLDKCLKEIDKTTQNN